MRSFVSLDDSLEFQFGGRLKAELRAENNSAGAPSVIFALLSGVLEFEALQPRQVLHLIHSSERFNTRATHI